MTRIPRFSFLLFLCLLAQSAVGQERIPAGYECTAADGSTRRIEIEVDCSNRQPSPAGRDACRVEYTRDGDTEILWRARNDPSYCRPKVEELVGRLEESGFSCTAMGGPFCDDSAALAAPPPNDASPPKAVTATESGRGSITITPSNNSKNQLQDSENKMIYDENDRASVDDYLTFSRDARYGYFLAVRDARGLSTSKDRKESVDSCAGSTGPNRAFERLDDLIRKTDEDQPDTVPVAEVIDAFLDAECSPQAE